MRLLRIKKRRDVFCRAGSLERDFFHRGLLFFCAATVNLLLTECAAAINIDGLTVDAPVAD